MQFSIRRPKLPSSETHPEENTYRRLDVSAWLNHLNESGQVEEEYKLQKVRGVAAAAALLICSLLPWSVSPQVEAVIVCFRAGGKRWVFESIRTCSQCLAGGLAGTTAGSAGGQWSTSVMEEGVLSAPAARWNEQTKVSGGWHVCNSGVDKSEKEKLRFLYEKMQGLQGSTGSRS